MLPEGERSFRSFCPWKGGISVAEPWRVLVVEDDGAVGDTLAAFLEDEGFDVRLARSGEDALTILRSGWIPRVGVVDLRLPGMDGRAMVECARVLAPSMRFMVHTGSPGGVVEDVASSMGVDAKDIFIKPVRDLGLLVERLRRSGEGEDGHGA